MNENSFGLICTLIFGLLIFTDESSADEYVRDPNPTLADGQVPYYTAKDPRVCDLYLNNLNYFAHRNKPLSCGQPVASQFTNIRPVEWENLQPEQYPELFHQIVKRYLKDTFSTSDFSNPDLYEIVFKAVKDGSYVFRRAKLSLKGYLAFKYDNTFTPVPVTIETPFQIVQYGPDVLNQENPFSAYRCKQEPGRKMDQSTRSGRPLSYYVSADMNVIYQIVTDDVDYVTDLWLINGNLYGETFNDVGDVELSQFYSTPNNGIGFGAVCLYHSRK